MKYSLLLVACSVSVSVFAGECLAPKNLKAQTPTSAVQSEFAHQLLKCLYAGNREGIEDLDIALAEDILGDEYNLEIQKTRDDLRSAVFSHLSDSQKTHELVDAAEKRENEILAEKESLLKDMEQFRDLIVAPESAHSTK